MRLESEPMASRKKASVKSVSSSKLSSISKPRRPKAGESLAASTKESHAKPNIPGAKGGFVRGVAERRKLYKTRKELITLRIDSDVLQFFREKGKGYQATMNGYLAAYAQMGAVQKAQGYDKLPAEADPEKREMESRFYKCRKEQITLRLNADVIGHYKAMGKGYQSKMNQAVRDAMMELMLGDEAAQKEPAADDKAS